MIFKVMDVTLSPSLIDSLSESSMEGDFRIQINTMEQIINGMTAFSNRYKDSSSREMAFTIKVYSAADNPL